jgi:hypothetical protein
MRMYIFRDVFTGRIFKVHAHCARDAKVKVAREKGLNASNLAHVRPQDTRVCAS